MDLELTAIPDDDNLIEGDIRLVDGDFSWFMGRTDDEIIAETAQEIRCNLRMFKGEWFVDPTEGMPYFEEIFEKGIEDGRIGDIVKSAIRRSKRVKDIPEFGIDRDRGSRTATVVFIAVLDGGFVLRSSDFGPFVIGV